jgi:hypothetical protein
MTNAFIRGCVSACLGATGCLLLVGCADGSAEVTLTSFKDAYFPESMRVRCDAASYWRGPDHDMHIVARTESPGAPGESAIRQYLYARTVWNPNPGLTTTDSTALNAVIRYVVATSSGTIEYKGDGFVFFDGKPTDALEFAVESAVLELDSTTGDAPEVIGPARLVAKISAPRDDGRVARWLREMDRLVERGVDAASR